MSFRDGADQQDIAPIILAAITFLLARKWTHIPNPSFIYSLFFSVCLLCTLHTNFFVWMKGFFLSFFFFFFFMPGCFCLCLSMCSICTPGVCESEKRASDHLELELQMLVSCVCWEPKWVLCKNSKAFHFWDTTSSPLTERILKQSPPQNFPQNISAHPL